MQRISVHITDETKQRIDLAVKAKKKVEAELIREAIDAGLNIIAPKSNSAKQLLNLAKMAKGLPHDPKDPTDVSAKIDYYAWGGSKNDE